MAPTPRLKAADIQVDLNRVSMPCQINSSLISANVVEIKSRNIYRTPVTKMLHNVNKNVLKLIPLY
jgi:argininosuccinate synthase